MLPFSSSLPSLSSPVTWPRTRSSVTVIWSGWQTICAPTQSRPAALAALVLVASQINVLDRSRARSSAALVGCCFCISRCLYLCDFLGLFHFFSFLPPLHSHLSPFSLLGLAFIHTSLYHISSVIFQNKKVPRAYHMLCWCSSINIPSPH